MIYSNEHTLMHTLAEWHEAQRCFLESRGVLGESARLEASGIGCAGIASAMPLEIFPSCGHLGVFCLFERFGRFASFRTLWVGDDVTSDCFRSNFSP